MKKRWVGLLVCLAIGQAQAASFNCGKAKTKVEKLICADQELSELDETLSTAYARLLTDVDDPANLKIEQKAWLKERNRCSDTPCLKREYRLRMTKIKALFTSMALSVLQDVQATNNTVSGRYRMTSGKGYAVCEAYKRTLDKLGELHLNKMLEPLDCPSDLLDNTPGITRPQWKEVAFNFKLFMGMAALEADEYARVRADYDPSTRETPFDPARYPRLAKELRNVVAKQSYRMYVAEIDTNGDGRKETLMRLETDLDYGCKKTKGLFFVNPQLTGLDETPYFPNVPGMTMNRYGAPIMGGADVMQFRGKVYFLQTTFQAISFVRDPISGRLPVCRFEFTPSNQGGK